MGRLLLRPKQLARLQEWYAGHGGKIIFFSRFLPGLRALVPVFAGVSHLGAWRTGLPIALASAAWYGALIALGTLVGKNWDLIWHTFGSVNRVLAFVALVVAIAAAWVWWRTRRHWEAEP